MRAEHDTLQQALSTLRANKDTAQQVHPLFLLFILSAHPSPAHPTPPIPLFFSRVRVGR